MVTAVNPGTAAIKAKVGSKTYKCKVTVKKPILNKTSLSLKAGESFRLKLTNTVKAVTWSSSNTGVAAVSSAGVVSAKGAGSAVIKAVSSGKAYQCQVVVTKISRQETGDGKTTEKAPYIVEWRWKNFVQNNQCRTNIVLSVCNPSDRVLYTPCVDVKVYDSAGNLLTKYQNINFSYIAPHDTVTASYTCETGGVPADKVDLQLLNGSNGSINFSYMAPDSSQYTSTGKISVTNLKMTQEASGSTLYSGTLVNNSGLSDLRGTVHLVFCENGKLAFGSADKYTFNLKYAQNNEVYAQMSPEEVQQIDPSWTWKLVVYPTGRSE